MTPHNPHAGKSIIEIIWEDMDDTMDLLKEGGIPDSRLDPREGGWEDHLKELMDDMKTYGEERGRAQGLAYALAVLTNPYAVNVDEIKREALKRWKERHEND